MDEAEDSIDALRLFAAKKYALAIVDFGISPMTGFDVVMRMRQRHPEVRCILMLEVLDAHFRAAEAQFPFLDVVLSHL